MDYFVVKNKTIDLSNLSLVQHDSCIRIPIKIPKEDLNIDSASTLDATVNIMIQGSHHSDGLVYISDNEDGEEGYYFYWVVSHKTTKNFGEGFMSITIKEVENQEVISCYNTTLSSFRVKNSVERAEMEYDSEQITIIEAKMAALEKENATIKHTINLLEPITPITMEWEVED